MKMKKIKLLALVGAMAGTCMISAGCSSKEGQTYAWPLATCSSGETITNTFAQTFADYVEEYSDGEMKIQVYTDSTLGTDTELMETCKDGDIPFVVQSPSPQVSYMPELCVFDTPCVYSDIHTVRKNLETPELKNAIDKIYKDAGYELLGISDQGFRVTTLSSAYKGLDSIAGEKIRVMENKYHIAFWKAVGANPTPMTFSEVYIGLQQGTIDAQENAYPLTVTAKLYEQQKTMVDTNHVPDYVTMIVSDVFMKGLKPEQQEIIRKAADQARLDSYDFCDRKIKEAVTYLQEQGMEITAPTDEERAILQQKSQGVWESIKEQCGEDLFDAYVKMAQEK